MTAAPPRSGSTSATAAPIQLTDWLVDLLREPLDDMLIAADDVLFDWAKKAVGDEAQACFVFMRQLRVERASVIQRFVLALSTPPAETGATVADFDLDQLSLQDDDALEEDIAIGNMATRIDELAADALAELGRRAEWARQASFSLEDMDALQPRAVCRAFAEGLHAIEGTINLRLLMLKLFERAILPRLPGFYDALNTQLADAGIGQVEKTRPGVKPSPAPVAPSPEAASDTWTQGAPTLADAEGAHPLFGDAGVNPWSQAQWPTAESGGMPRPPLASGLPWTGSPQAYYASETQFAQEVAELLSPQQLPQAPRPLAQRLEIVNRLFQGVRDDPMVRPELRPTLDALRYPLFKAALTDPGLIADAQHPLRRLVDDATVLASARSLPLEELRPLLSELVDLALSRLSPSAHQAREGLARRDTIPDELLAALEVQLTQSRQTRRRRLVDLAADGARHTLVSALLPGRRMALKAEDLVGRELVPLLALAELNFGRESRAYQETHKVATDWMVAYCNAPVPDTEVRRIVEELAHALVWARYPSERRERIAEATRALLGSPPELQDEHLPPSAAAADAAAVPPGDRQTAPPLAPPQAPDDTASALDTPTAALPQGLLRAPHARISVGSYASVHDDRIGRARWLRLASRHDHARTLVFTDFCEEVRLQLGYDRFDEDIASGRSRLISG